MGTMENEKQKVQLSSYHDPTLILVKYWKRYIFIYIAAMVIRNHIEDATDVYHYKGKKQHKY